MKLQPETEHPHGLSDKDFDALFTKDKIDRFNLVQDVIDRLPQLGDKAAYIKEDMKDKLIQHRNYIRTHGVDMPEVKD